MTDEALGWLDTNIFVHALFTRDSQYDRCRAVLQALREGRANGWVDVLVVHELTYVLGRLPQFATRAAIHEYIRGILSMTTVHADDKQALLATLARWATENVGFTDARLAVLAQAHGLPICSANLRDFSGVSYSFVTASF
ncbi:MAG TPA: PIN domain-containing protein [Chloroflexota bacterium]|jgi:predicted nucleic acid-binding protein